ncbi:unnamed protein product [Haemonchus placei]|uniref:Endoplasmic reticulum resident protein 29 n=1 Tax=Haemonchus placei TaxID=6290 RepID=A0A0N4X709_HAEPC|nr:unnamed protein product [Haemonchus placei]
MNPITVIVMLCISFSMANKCKPDPLNFDYEKFEDMHTTDKEVLKQNLKPHLNKEDLFLLWQVDVNPDPILRKNAVPTVVFPHDNSKDPFFFVYYPAKSNTTQQFEEMSAKEFVDFLDRC